MVSHEAVTEALRRVKYPGYSRDIVSFGLLKNLQFRGNNVHVQLQLNSAAPAILDQIRSEALRSLMAVPGIGEVQVEFLGGGQTTPTPGAASGANPFGNQARMEGVNSIIAVASGKGGVGKSTCSVNLACGLSQLGVQVGLLDCDIYGPSIPLMMGIRQKPTVTQDEKLVPPVSHGVRLMSMGFLIEGDSPVIWRGPMIMKTIQQFIFSVDWGNLDVLLVDLPPGTGDAQLSLCQTVPLNGGVIITTPQEASLGVVRKGIGMFEKVHVPIWGIVENMSYFTAPNGDRVEIFGHGGGRNEAKRLNVPFLGEIPLFTEIREGGDRGVPVVVSSPGSKPAEAFLSIARDLQGRLVSSR
jgi:ATP-binding protein involved in chromosome partitioning